MQDLDSHHRTADPWDDIAKVVMIQAETDLEHNGEGGLYLAAADGPEPLFVAASRPFAKGGYGQPIVELVALALPLGADRLAVGVTGRAWSLDDPIAPVIDGADLRQRILSLHLADGHGRDVPVRRDLVIPFELDGTEVRWADPMDLGLADGWIPHALAVFLEQRATLRDDTSSDVREQFERCVRLGHDVGISLAAAVRLYPEVAADAGAP